MVKGQSPQTADVLLSAKCRLIPARKNYANRFFQTRHRVKKSFSRLLPNGAMDKKSFPPQCPNRAAARKIFPAHFENRTGDKKFFRTAFANRAWGGKNILRPSANAAGSTKRESLRHRERFPLPHPGYKPAVIAKSLHPPSRRQKTQVSKSASPGTTSVPSPVLVKNVIGRGWMGV